MRAKDLRSLIATSLVCFTSFGCTIHPLPEDVTNLPTNAIVNHIRCEARYAFANAAGIFIERSSEIDSYGKEVGSKLIDRTIDISQLDISKLSSYQRYYINKYLPVALAYDFTFDMSEDNSASLQFSIVDLFPQRSLGIGTNASIDRSRQNIRNVRVTDTFGGFMKNPGFCTKYTANQDFIYPITGRIGIDEMVKTFVDLNQFQNLSAPKDAKDKAPTLADQLIFTTTIIGSIAPGISFTPPNPGLRLASASFNAGASRKDSHKVIVALSLPPKRAQDACASTPSFLTKPSNNNFNMTPAERCALSEIDTQVQRNIINNLAIRQGF